MHVLRTVMLCNDLFRLRRVRLLHDPPHQHGRCRPQILRLLFRSRPAACPSHLGVVVYQKDVTEELILYPQRTFDLGGQLGREPTLHWHKPAMWPKHGRPLTSKWLQAPPDTMYRPQSFSATCRLRPERNRDSNIDLSELAW